MVCAEEHADGGGAPRLSHPDRIANNKSGSSTAGAKGVNSHVERPVEVLQKIFGLLEINDIKNARLACASWATAARRPLFQRLIFRPDRDDFGRFNTLVTNDLLGGINALIFDLSTMEFDEAEELISKRYIEDLRPSFGPYVPNILVREARDWANAQKDAAVKEYGQWNARWHLVQQNYRDLRNMESMFSKISVLESLDITYKNSNFSSEALQRAWLPSPNREPTFDRTRTKQETITILRALEGCPGRDRLKRFSHDKLPHSFFVIDNSVLEKLSSSFRNLTTFHIQMDDDCGLEKWRRAWTRLGQLLVAMEHLEDLRFGINGVRTAGLEYSEWELNQEQLQGWYVPLWKVLGEAPWKSLKALRIEGLLLCEQGLVDVIGRHAATLRRLDLKHIGLWQGNFQSLLTKLKPVLKLDRFRIWGSLQSFHSRSKQECWRFRPRIAPEAECWSVGFKKSYMKYEDHMTDHCRNWRITNEKSWRSLIGYMQSPISAPWPLCFADIVRDMLFLSEAYHTETCTDCTSTQDIAKEWDESVTEETPNVEQMADWTEQEIKHDRVVTEELIKAFYDASGFDSQGYDKNGFSTYGEHMENKVMRRCTYSLSIVDMVVRREMLSQIPRYVEAGVAPTTFFPLEYRDYRLFSN